jgi:hypothetical protein
MNKIELAKQSLAEYGYTMLQYEGVVPEDTAKLTQELDNLAYRLIGFDNMFNTETFSTYTYIKDKEGFLNLLKVDLFKRFVTKVELLDYTQKDGIIYTSSPRLIIHLNHTHNRINSFKSAFIGRGGKEIKALSQFLDCGISLV